MVEFRTLAEPLRPEEGKLVGYGAVYGRPSKVLSRNGRPFRETFLRGAFAKSLTDPPAGDITAHFGHDEDARPPLGRLSAGTLKLREDIHGLRVEIDPPGWAADVVEAVRRGDLRGMSVSFGQADDRWEYRDGEHHRLVTSADLFHVAVVARPAYDATSLEVRNQSQILVPDMAWLHKFNARLMETAKLRG